MGLSSNVPDAVMKWQPAYCMNERVNSYLSWGEGKDPTPSYYLSLSSSSNWDNFLRTGFRNCFKSCLIISLSCCRRSSSSESLTSTYRLTQITICPFIPTKDAALLPFKLPKIFNTERALLVKPLGHFDDFPRTKNIVPMYISNINGTS